jgi:hypothetical protein
MRDEILKDLKAEYPKTKILNVRQVADQLARSPEAMYKLKERQTLKLKFKKDGGRYFVTIYAMADYIASLYDEEEQEKATVAVKKQVKKSTQNEIPLSKILFNTFCSTIDEMKEQVYFHEELAQEFASILREQEFKLLENEVRKYLPKRERKVLGGKTE